MGADRYPYSIYRDGYLPETVPFNRAAGDPGNIIIDTPIQWTLTAVANKKTVMSNLY